LQYIFSPLEKWILKKELEYVEYLFAAELQDDDEIDNVEERKLYVQIKNLLTEEIFETVVKQFGFKDQVEMFRHLESLNKVEKLTIIKRMVAIAMILHVYSIGVEPMKALARMLILEAYDKFWMEHLDTMADLREGISLRNLAQRDPLVEYKNEGFQMFDDMLKKIDESVSTRFFRVRLVQKQEQIPVKTNDQEDKRPGKTGGQKTITKNKKVGRNDPCPCGSGKKYKKCCFPKYE